MSKYDFIYLNGDSYSAKYSARCYGDFLQDKLGIPVFNKACMGSNNYRITRITLENILEIKSQHPRMLVILGMSFITRDEIWYEDTVKQSMVIPDNAEFPESRLTTSRVLDNGAWDEIKDHIVDLNINRQLVHFYTNLYMLTQTLENFGVDYFIFSAARNDGWREANWSFINSLRIAKECNSNPKIFNLHNFSIPEFAKQNNIDTASTGHLYEDGHDKFSNFLIEKLDLF
jgi:hypothetical protein